MVRSGFIKPHGQNYQHKKPYTCGGSDPCKTCSKEQLDDENLTFTLLQTTSM